MSEHTIPVPQDSDSAEVRVALETASALWKSSPSEALRWLRRAAETCADEGDDLRSVRLAMAAADLRTASGIGASSAPDGVDAGGGAAPQAFGANQAPVISPAALPHPQAAATAGRPVDESEPVQAPDSVSEPPPPSFPSGPTDTPMGLGPADLLAAMEARRNGAGSSPDHSAPSQPHAMPPEQEFTPPSSSFHDLDSAPQPVAVSASQTGLARPAGPVTSNPVGVLPSTTHHTPHASTQLIIAQSLGSRPTPAGGIMVQQTPPAPPTSQRPEAVSTQSVPGGPGLGSADMASAAVAERPSINQEAAAAASSRAGQTQPVPAAQETSRATHSDGNAATSSPGSSTTHSKLVMHQAVRVAIRSAVNADGSYELRTLSVGENAAPGWTTAVIVNVDGQLMFPGRT